MRLKIDTTADACGPPPNNLFKFIDWCLRGTYPILIIAAVASLISGVVETISTALIGVILDLVLETSSENLIRQNAFYLILAAGFFFILRPLFFGLAAYFQSVVVSPGIRALVATRLHRWTLGHAKSFFDDDFAGRIAQKEVQASSALSDAVIELINTVLFALASVLSAFCIVGLISLKLAAAILIWFVGFYFVMRFFMPRIKIQSKQSANAQAVATGQIVDTISNIEVVKLFSNSKHEEQAASNTFQKLKERLIDYGGELLRFRISIMIYASIVFGVIFSLVLILWIQGDATPGEVVIAGSVSMRLTMMAGWVSFSIMTIYTKLGEIEDAMITLAVPQKMLDAKEAQELIHPKGKIEFKNVSFTYGRSIGGIKDLSLKINPGDRIGIVGESGAGKSTFVSLLLRLHEVEEGQILIDNQRIEKLKQHSLRKNISMVTQETSMFNRSAKENILYGNPEASTDKIIDAAKKAGAHDFIKGLADVAGRRGYDAHLGERGVKLSGGQRQRIALARALIKDAPILILDEATSALDSEVEASIQDALQHVMSDKTVIAIAHRLSTIANMDRIIVLDDGFIAENGSHSELLESGGLYAKFWHRQSGGFLSFQNAAE